jgi:uncharacterized protein DUF3303
MLFITTYKVKPHLTREETKELLAAFADKGTPPGTKAHYVAADNSHGLVISESDDAAEGYRNILNYTQWVEYHTHAVLTIEEALPHIMDAFG